MAGSLFLRHERFVFYIKEIVWGDRTVCCFKNTLNKHKGRFCLPPNQPVDGGARNANLLRKGHFAEAIKLQISAQIHTRNMRYIHNYGKQKVH